MKGDSIEGIYDTLKNCACISKNAGGIGLSVHNIRATHSCVHRCAGGRRPPSSVLRPAPHRLPPVAARSYIRGTNGTSNGIVPMLRVFSATARYVDQGGGKRKGAFAVYLEPWHADIYEFLDLKKNHGAEAIV